MPTLVTHAPLYTKKSEEHAVTVSFTSIEAGKAVTVIVDLDNDIVNSDLVAALRFATERMIKAIHKSEVGGY